VKDVEAWRRNFTDSTSPLFQLHHPHVAIVLGERVKIEKRTSDELRSIFERRWS